jgi:hypothetical protein
MSPSSLVRAALVGRPARHGGVRRGQRGRVTLGQPTISAARSTAIVQTMPEDSCPSAGAGTTIEPPGPLPEKTSVVSMTPMPQARAFHRSPVSSRTARRSAPTPITAITSPSGTGPQTAAWPIVPATP